MKCNCGYDESSYLSRLNHRDKFLKIFIGAICRDSMTKEITAKFDYMYICPACGTMKVNIKEGK